MCKKTTNATKFPSRQWIMSEMLRDTCIWYRGCTRGADAVGSGHNCSPFGCFSKETCEARRLMSDTTVARLNLHQRKTKIMKFLGEKWRKWLNTYWGQSRRHWTHHRSAEPSPDHSPGKWEKNVLLMEQVQNPWAKNTTKDPELGRLVNTRVSYWALAWFESWIGPFMSAKLSLQTQFSGLFWGITIQRFGQ